MEMEEMDKNQVASKEEKARLKHLTAFHNTRSAVALMRMTKDFNMHLTQLSDQKANIIIGASTIIISVGIIQLEGNEGFVMVAISVLILGGAIALLFAILSVTPLFNKQTAKMTIDSKGFNPLFFGHYTDVPIDDYIDHMLEVLKDQDKLYRQMIIDLYQMGLVLKTRKFKYLAIAYQVFFVSIFLFIILMAISFIISIAF